VTIVGPGSSKMQCQMSPSEKGFLAAMQHGPPMGPRRHCDAGVPNRLLDTFRVEHITLLSTTLPFSAIGMQKSGRWHHLA
jgi:hypothetical protein